MLTILKNEETEIVVESLSDSVANYILSTFKEVGATMTEPSIGKGQVRVLTFPKTMGVFLKGGILIIWFGDYSSGTIKRLEVLL